MSVICPTILADTPDEFARQSQLLTFAPRVQIDITDGKFAPSVTVNLNQIYWEKDQKIDLHLMIEKPSEWTEMIVSLNPHLAIFHAESDGDLLALFEHLRKFGMKIGVAILPETSIASACKLIASADHVLIFGGNLGFQGGAASLVNLSKISEIKAINSHAEIGWDGGANVGNVAEIASAGVDVINVGSAIMRAENPEAEFKQLAELAK